MSYALVFWAGAFAGTVAGFFLAAILTAGKVADMEAECASLRTERDTLERIAHRPILSNVMRRIEPPDDGRRYLRDISHALERAEAERTVGHPMSVQAPTEGRE